MKNKNNLVCSVKLARVENGLRYFIRKFDPVASLNVRRKEQIIYGNISSFIEIGNNPFYTLDVSLAEDTPISGAKNKENLAVLVFSESSNLNDELTSKFGQNTGINFSDETPDEILKRAENIFLPGIYDILNKYS